MAAAKPEVRHNSVSRPDRNAVTFPIRNSMDKGFGTAFLFGLEAEL